MSLLESEAGAAGAAAAAAAADPTPLAISTSLEHSAQLALASDASDDVVKVKSTSPQPIIATAPLTAPPLQAQEQQSPPQNTPPAQPAPSASAIGSGSITPHVPTSLGASALERGPLGLAPDEEDWVKDRMEYALYE